jgi:hypothetical protein
MVETHAMLLAATAADGWAVAPAVVDSWTEPPKAPVRLTPLQLPLKLELKLLSVSGTVNAGAMAKALVVPAVSVACTWNL